MPETYFLASGSTNRNISNNLISGKEVIKQKDIKVYPTIISDNISIINDKAPYSILIFDQNNRLIFENKSENLRQDIDLSKYHTGWYIVNIITSDITESYIVYKL